MEAGGQRLIRYRDPSAVFSIYDFADLHFGDTGCAKDLLAADIARVQADPFALWYLGGDYCSWIAPGDPRFDPETIDEEIKARDFARLGAVLAAKIVEMFEPMKLRCMGCCYGNHELKYITAKAQAWLHESICNDLDAANLRYCGFTDLWFRHDPSLDNESGVLVLKRPKPEDCTGRRLRVLVHHGFSSAATDGGKLQALARLVNSMEADLCIMGHVHTQLSKVFVKLGADALCQKIVQRATMGLITGSYLRTYVSNATMYGEMKGYQPSVLGVTRATFAPKPLNELATLTVENRADL